MVMYDRSELESYLEEFQTQCEERLGETGRELSSGLHKLVDLILTEQDERVRERVNELADKRVGEWIKELAAPWALQGSDEPIPVSKFDKEGIMRILFAPGFMTDGEQLELARSLLEDLTKRGVK